MDSSATPATAGGVQPPVEAIFTVPVTVAAGAAGGYPTSVDVVSMISATNVKKRKRAGTHVVPQSSAMVVASPAINPAVPQPARVRTKVGPLGPKGTQPPKMNRPVSRPPHPPASSTPSPSPVASTPPPTNVSGAPNVLDNMSR